MSDLAKRLAALTPEKRKQLLLRLQAQKKDSRHLSIQPRKRDTSILPLSFAQERLWFLEQWAESSAWYNVPMGFCLSGLLHVRVLEHCLGTIVQRHEVLRTAFSTQEGRPVQMITANLALTVPVIDLRNCFAPARDQQVRQLARADAHHPFSLEVGPLWRIYLLQLGEQEYVLLFTIHHIVFDGKWSMGILVRELAVLYQARLQGKPSPLPSLPIQYADYAIWQRQQLQGEVLESHLAYWRRQLSGVPALLELPTDHPRPAVQTDAGAQQSLLLQPSLLQALKSLSQQEGATLFMTLLAAFQILLMRYSGRSDIVVGTPITNRGQAGLENLIGFFANTLVMRTDLAGNPSFRQLLTCVREIALQAYMHQDLPFEKIVESLQIERTLSHPPLVQVFFALQNVPVSDVQLADISWSQLDREHTITHFDISFVLIEEERGLLTVVEYSTDLFRTATMICLLGHWRVLLEAIVRDPEQAIETLPLLTGAERAQLLVEWNATTRERPTDQCLHQLFEQQVSHAPDAVAVFFEEQHLSYEELNRRSNQLAHALCSRGVGPERFVVVFMERSLLLVIALLGTLKAGGVYVPLDPTAPYERLRWIIETLKPTVLLTQAHLLISQSLPCTQRLHLDTDWPSIAHESVSNPHSPVTPEHLAYIIYTSGSTGQPKGVMMSHRAICNSLQWMQETFHLTPSDSIMHKTPTVFDASLWELCWPLLGGARIVVARPEGQKDSTYLHTLIIEQQVTTLFFVPSLLQVFLQELNVEHCQSLRLMLCGGETLSSELQQRFWMQHPAALWNLYGPTEAAIQATAWHCLPGQTGASVPIGRPIANTQIYLLDAPGRLVPVGVPGEIYIGGTDLARGYLYQPELTAERFIPHPFSQEPGARLYRTGDIARYRTNGAIEYLGRIDQQVKVRGLRIELGEIEVVLAKHPAIRESIVVLHEESESRKVLVAYIVPRTLEATITEQVQQYLYEQLPHYMVPTKVVMLKAFPLTPTGKIDRKALPAPTAPDHREPTFAAPRSELEYTLTTIWQQVLGCKQVSINDNFFALGGDSILSMQIIARARQAGLQLTPKQLFQYQTIAQLAAVARKIVAAPDEHLETSGPVLLTPIQHWFFQQHLPQPQHFNQAVLLQVPASWRLHHLQQVVDAWFVQHDALRLRYERTEQGWQQRLTSVVEAGVVVVLYVDLTRIEAGSQDGAIERVANRVQASLDLQKGPLLRVILFTLGNGQAARLLVVIHHLAVDGVSWRVLLADLQIAMTQLQGKKPIVMPARTTSFQRWAEHLQKLAQSAFDKDRAYWLTVAQIPTGPLPLDKLEGRNTGASAHTVSVVLTTQETRLLLQDALRPYHSHVQELILVALLRTLARWLSTRHIRLHLEGHGREDLLGAKLDVSHTVGWFTSLYPVLFTVPQDNGAGSWIKTVKEQLRNVPHRGVSYGLLRYLSEDLELREQLSCAASPEVSFNYLGQFDQMLSTPSTGQQPAVEAGVIQLASESIGASMAPENQRTHLLDVSALVAGGQLHLQWTYSEQLHHHTTIEQLAREVVQALRELLAHCLTPEAGGFTPSDFPLARLDQATLDQLLASRESQVEDLYPLTPLQHGLLFHTLSAPQPGVYIEQVSCVLQGEVQVEAVERAWQQVISQHAILRTAFVWQELSEPLQIVFKQVVLPVRRLDWRSYSSQRQEAELQAFLQADRRQGFEMGHAPLMRLTLIRLSETRTQLIWTHHHLLLDGWSVSMLLQEVLAYYEAIVQGQSVVCEERRPYREYIGWLAEQDDAAAEVYWRRTLAGIDAPTPLLVEQRVPSYYVEQAYREEVMHVTAATTAQWHKYTRQQRVTLNTLIQATWALILARYSGQASVLFGSVVAGRPPELAGVERMIGLFINTVPVHVRVHEEQIIGNWLTHLQEQQLEQRSYEYSSLVQVQGWSEIAREHPLFESLLVFENYPLQAALAEHKSLLTVASVQVMEQTNYAMTILVEPGAELCLRVSYDCRRFEQATIARLLLHIHNCLQQLVANSQQGLASVSLLTAEEREQLLSTFQTSRHPCGWGNGDNQVSSDLCTHQLIEQQARQTPETIAVVFEETALTYQQLNDRANQLANVLQRTGAGPDVLVGVCMERSLELVVGLLAILKAGAAYVPLDPSYPGERLALLLQETQPALILTQTHFKPDLSSLCDQITCLVTSEYCLIQESCDNPVSRVSAENLAYIIHTSGSSGRPKGVMVTHQGLANYLLWGRHYYQVTSGSSAIVHSSLNFDLTITSLFLPLISGGTVLLASQEKGIDNLVAMIHRHPYLSFLKVTPAHLELLNQMLDASQLATVAHTLILGGEALPVEHLAIWRAFSPQTRIINEYGPTETVVGCSIYEVEIDHRGEGVVPIGYPIVNSQLYILDAHGHLVPRGVIGEIYIGGPGVARGYKNQPDLTAECFLPHPCVAAQFIAPGARLYRSGDLARYRADGAIEYLGRIDSQVKLRGYRIELGEIETALRANPAVQECVVVLRDESEKRKVLAAYVVARVEETPTVEQLQAYLSTQLPDYMIPTIIRLLERLPLTLNGKVDRKALSGYNLTPCCKNKVQGLPSTPLQELLVTIWQDVLGLPRVGVHDNFFELGGHSLLVMQVVVRIRQILQVDLPLSSFFSAPTIASQAAQLEGLMRSHLCSPTAGLSEGETAGETLLIERSGDLPLSFAQERLWFLHQWAPSSAWYNVPLAFGLSGLLHVEALGQSLAMIVQRHEVLRTTFEIRQGQPVQVINPCGQFGLHILIDLQRLKPGQREQEAQRLAKQEAQYPFDLAHGPLLRVYLLRLAVDELVPQEHILLFTLHHIVTDGWSMGVLLQELSMLYQAQLQGKSVSLPALPLQYADYAIWQRQWLQGKVLQDLLAYWREQLSDAPALLELPADRSRPAVQTDAGALQTLLLPPTLLQALKSVSQREGVTLFMTLLAAFQVLLMRYSGQQDIVVGTPIACRGQAGLENLIGFFVNILVLRTDLSGNPSYRQLLARVREVALQAYMHQELPFEKLVDSLQVERSLSYSPLFQVCFALQNVPSPDVKLAGLRWHQLDREHHTSQFDISLMVTEGDSGLLAEVEYSTALFDAPTIMRLLSHWQVLLEAVVHDPRQSIEMLPLLTAQEREQLLKVFQTSPVRAFIQKPPNEINLCLHQFIQQQVEQTPEAIAIVLEDAALTYRVLNNRANQLAHVLQRMGIGPDVLVGVFMERSLELIIGLLAILKAGAAFVPLDPSYPEARLTWMLKDTQPALILTQMHLTNILLGDQSQCIYLDTDWECWSGEPTCNVTSEVTPQNLAYVIYTSGSTGRPKGAMNTHLGVCNTLLWKQDTYPLMQSDCLLQKTSLSFDMSLEEIFWPLIAGARLVIARPESYQQSYYLVSLIVQCAITVLDIVPSVLQLLLDEPDWSVCHSLRLVLCGGEMLLLALQQRFFATHSASLQNLYGPTEAAINAAFWSCQPGHDGDRVPIGHPITATQIYLLDRWLQPVPIGVPGVLYIGGVNLARGYLNRADLTAEYFIPHPESLEEGARIYFTGDLARYRPDSTIEVLGRIDQQVKLRGLRIELAEIEATLMEHPAIKDCAVLAREDLAGGKQLVAYLVVYRGQALTASDVHSYLQDHLPRYMIPSTIVSLLTLPLTPNHKVDRHALARMMPAKALEHKMIVAPRTPIENALAAIWTDLLNLEQVSISDNFFEVGGHSLLAVQLLNRIHKQFGRSQLSLATLFQAPTIEQVAAVLQRTMSFVSISSIVTLHHQGEKRPFFCVHDGTGGVYCFLELVKRLRRDRPCYGIQAPGLSADEGLFISIEEMATSYINELLLVQPEGPYLLAGYCFGGLVAFEMARQLQTQGRSMALLALLDSYPAEKVVSPAADTRNVDGRKDDAHQIVRAVESLSRSWKKQIPLSYDELHNLQPDEQLSYLLARLKEAQVMPDDMDLPHFRRSIRVIDAHNHCIQHYQPKPYVGRVILFRNEYAIDDPLLWATLASEPLEIHTVAGDHISMLQEPYVQYLVAQLQLCIDETEKE